MNGHNRFGNNVSPRSRRAFAARRPISVPVSRRPTSISANRHTPRRLANKSISSVDAATQRGNIQVVVRVRPTNNRESAQANRTVVQVIDERLLVFDPKETVNDFYYHGKKQQGSGYLKRNKDVKLAFDCVYAPSSTNDEIFQGTIKRSLDTLIQGYNCSVFAYGATGSGKTFTMLGSGDENPGLTFLTLMDLYARLKTMENDYESSVSVSYLEVYNETVRDLLNTGNKPSNLNILEDENGVSVPNLTTLKPMDESDLFKLLSDGNSRRTQHPTDHNAESSRSHAVFQVHVTLRARYTDFSRNIRSAKLVMVDLAGSERGTATGFCGERFREGASINKSLLALGNCINALADGRKHVPYRDSKLTRLLKDSLGGNCKTIVIANVSPSSLSYDDTYNTLKYANRAKHIRFNVKKNEVVVAARIAEYEKIVQEMQDKINTLGAENELYKTNCKCLTNNDSDDSVVESEKENEQTDEVGTFKTLKRRYSETLGVLKATDLKIQLKKSRLNFVSQNNVGGVGNANAVQRLRHRLSGLEQRKEKLVTRSETEGMEVEKAISSAAVSDQVIPLPLQEVLRLKGIEAELESLRSGGDREKESLLEEMGRTENLLGRCMVFVKNIYQLSHFHKNTTKQQDAEFEALRFEYMGHPRLRWADQEEILKKRARISSEKINEKRVLNETFCAGSNLNNTYTTYQN